MVNEQINLARDAFQSANVIQQLQIEALRGELRLRGLFSAQPRPTSLAYESTLAVLLKQMSDNSSSITLSKTMMSNPHKYELPSMLPRDLGAIQVNRLRLAYWLLQMEPTLQQLS